eukprot:gene16508-18150_t
MEKLLRKCPASIRLNRRFKFCCLIRAKCSSVNNQQVITDSSIRSFIESSKAKDFLMSCSQKQQGKELFKKMFSRNKPEAGILVPICIVDEKTCLLYTLRSSNLSSHRSEVSFPGGKRDPTDKTIQDAAMRETCEELGINRSIIDLWAPLRPQPNRQRTMIISPFVSYLGKLILEDLPINHNEVSEVFAIPITNLLDARYQYYTTFRNGSRLPVFTAAHRKVWGLSAVITDSFLSTLYPDQYKSKLLIGK